MKKIILLCTVFFVIHVSLKAQITINDTLRYFTYKQLYKLPVNPVHPSYKATSATAITHIGSVFKNNQALRVTGLEATVLKNAVTSGTASVPMRLFLCNVVNGFPVFPPLDSVSIAVSNTTSIQFGQKISSTFTSSVPRIVNGDFAVLARCTSTLTADTVKIFRTSGHTSTSTTVPSQQKFGENFGVLRQAGLFTKTTNYNDPQFGTGTDYEFCVAPIVTFILEANQNPSPTMEGACEYEVFTNTNTSTPAFTNRQFNFNEFYRQLKPFDASFPPFTPDSVLAFEMGDGMPPFYLPVNTNTLLLAYYSGVSNIFVNGNVTGKYKRMAHGVNAATETSVLNFTSSTVWCNEGEPPVGISEAGSLNNLVVFPNPVSDKITVSNLSGKNTIQLCNIIGQAVFTEISLDNELMLPLADLPKGTYFLKITNTENISRVIKFLKL